MQSEANPGSKLRAPPVTDDVTFSRTTTRGRWRGPMGSFSQLAQYVSLAPKVFCKIRGQTVAVDLAGWVCDSQNVTEYFIQPKLYLRNLFFRTAYLLLADITPVFVLDGEAPELKRDVMALRNAIQFRGAPPKDTSKSGKKNPDVGRKRFRGVLKECENLLKCMGVACVKGEGEAEATCAQLNSQGIVHAIVSQDSDCFAYGARMVYRNFSVSNSAGGGAMQGSIDCYDVNKMIESNGFGRNKMVALALLCGCDYGVGACGSSIATVLAFLQTIPDTNVIARLVSWVSDPDEYEKKSRWVNVPGRCDKCGHAGRTHTKNGCPVCVTHNGCHDTGHKTKVAEVKRELSLRTRALNCGSPFPEPLVMQEFLHRSPEVIDTDDLKPCAPSMIRFVKLMSMKLDWTEKYCVGKFLPLLTKFHLQDQVPNRTMKPEKINKKRAPKGIPSYEVVWADIDGQYEGLIPDDQFEDDEDHSSAWTTIERQDLMQKYYPDLVETFEASKRKPVKEKKINTNKNINSEPNVPKTKRKYTKKTAKVAKAVSILYDSINNKSLHNTLNNSKLNVSVKVNKLKRKRKTTAKANQKMIDSYLKAKKKRLSDKLINSLRYSFKNLSIEVVSDEQFDNILTNDIEKENINTNQNESLSLFDLSNDSINESDLSNIVEDIVKKSAPIKTANVNNNFVKLIFARNSTPRKSGFRKSLLNPLNNKCSTPNGSPNKRGPEFQMSINNDTDGSKVDTSYFFDKLTENCDAFETSVNYNYCDDNEVYVVSDDEKTVNYSITNKL